MEKAPGTIFLSYSSADTAIATKIYTALTDAAVPTWIDKVEIKPGDSFVRKIDTALGQASYLVLLLSHNSLPSPWVQREWMSALAGNATVVIPVLVEKCEVPAILRDIHYVDLTDYEIGLHQLLSFFKAEFSPGISPEKAFSPTTNRARMLSRRDLRLIAQNCLNDSDLQTFLFDAAVDPGIIGGTSLHERLVSLLHYANREGIVEHFSAWLTLEKSRCVEHALLLLKKQPRWREP